MIIKGRISGEEDRKSIRAEDIIALKDAKKYYKKIFINVNEHSIDEGTLKQLCSLINDNQGSCEVWFRVNNDKESKKFRSRTLKINPDSDVLNQIKGMLGKDGIKIYGRI